MTPAERIHTVIAAIVRDGQITPESPAFQQLVKAANSLGPYHPPK